MCISTTRRNNTQAMVAESWSFTDIIYPKTLQPYQILVKAQKSALGEFMTFHSILQTVSKFTFIFPKHIRSFFSKNILRSELKSRIGIDSPMFFEFYLNKVLKNAPFLPCCVNKTISSMKTQTNRSTPQRYLNRMNIFRYFNRKY